MEAPIERPPRGGLSFSALRHRHCDVLILTAMAAVERQQLVAFQRWLHANQIHFFSALVTGGCDHRRHMCLPRRTTKAAAAVAPIIPINRVHPLTGGSSIPGRYFMRSEAAGTALVPGASKRCFRVLVTAGSFLQSHTDRYGCFSSSVQDAMRELGDCMR